MTFKQRIAVLCAALVAALGGIAIVSSPAQAAQEECPAARICVWKTPDFTGSPAAGLRYDFAEFSFRNLCFTVGGSFNDAVNSVKLNQPQGLGHVVFYPTAGCAGSLVTIPVGNTLFHSLKNCLGSFGSWNATCSSPTISSARYVYP